MMAINADHEEWLFIDLDRSSYYINLYYFFSKKYSFLFTKMLKAEATTDLFEIYDLKG